MSEVISFRLDKDNPREARARSVLKTWYSEGHSVRYILTEALLKLGKPEPEQAGSKTLEELNETLTQIRHLLKQMKDGRYMPTEKSNGEQGQVAELTGDFVASIKQAVKPGLKLG